MRAEKVGKLKSVLRERQRDGEIYRDAGDERERGCGETSLREREEV